MALLSAAGKMDQKRECSNAAGTGICLPVCPKDHEVEAITIVFKEDMYREVMGYCLRDSKERACFVLGGVAKSNASTEIYARKLYIPEERYYQNREGAYLEIDPDYLALLLNDFALTDNRAVVAMHSHPFARGKVSFSQIDTGTFNEVVGHFFMRKECICASLVFGREGVYAGMFTASPGEPKSQVCLKVIGVNGIESGMEHTRTHDVDMGMFDRQIPLFSVTGQQKINMTRLAVVGLGGVGSSFAAKAVRHGFLDITIIDHDLVEASNLNRLAGAGWRDIGVPKVDVVKRELEEVSQSVRCRAFASPVQGAMQELGDADVVVSCVDSDETRLTLQDYCSRHYKPLLDFGAGGTVRDGKITNLGSHVRFYIPGHACLCCMGLNSEEIEEDSMLEFKRQVGYIDGLDETPVTVESINSIAASLGIEMLTRYISGQGMDHNYVHYDSLSQTSKPLLVGKDETCPMCGEDSIEGLGEFEYDVEGIIHLNDAAMLERSGILELTQPRRNRHNIRQRRRRYFTGVEWWLERSGVCKRQPVPFAGPVPQRLVLC